MFTIRKIAASTLTTIAGLAALLLAVGPGAGLADGATVNSEISVVADSPWGSIKP